jgi:hypothetical protein
MHVKKLTLTTLLCLAAVPAFATQSITCISGNNAIVRCDLSHADQRSVRLGNEISGDCNGSNAWGTDSTAVWVYNCGAVFQYEKLASTTTTTNYSNNYNTDGYNDGYSGPNIVIAPGIGGYDEPYYYGPEHYYPSPVFFYGGGTGYYNHYNHSHDEHHGGSSSYHGGGYHGGGYHGGGYHGAGGYHGGGGGHHH